jgi:hypothetical protein
MMMVMIPVMAVALHLFETIREEAWWCQLFGRTIVGCLIVQGPLEKPDDTATPRNAILFGNG